MQSGAPQQLRNKSTRLISALIPVLVTNRRIFQILRHYSIILVSTSDQKDGG